MNLQDQQYELMLIGKKLAQLRRDKGYANHEKFADDFDLPRVQYWRLEKGRANFTIRTLTRVLAAHNLSLPEFFSSLRK